MKWMLTASLVAGLAVCAAAQAPPRPSFGAASIKANRTGFGPVRVSSSPGRFSAVNVSLRVLIRTAYGLPDFKMSGGPSWIDVDRFDVEATADAAAVGQPINAMLQSLLEERFRLTAHMETRELPIYALIIARTDGKLGSQLRKSGEECVPPTIPAGAPPPPPPPPGSGARGSQCPSIQGPGVISGRKTTMGRLADAIAGSVGRVVIDRTGLDGTFDLDLQWLPERVGGPPAEGRGLTWPGQSDLPSIFTALSEQLGLKLDSRRGPVDVLVIERAEKPSQE